jgi:hypothetical protein
MNAEPNATKRAKPGARGCLRGADLVEDQRAGLRATSVETMPLRVAQRGRLLERWRTVPASRGHNTSFRVGPVLTLVAMRLAGRPEIPEITRFATILSQAQRLERCLPRMVGT